jgi:protein O-mannosyl-transferase
MRKNVNVLVLAFIGVLALFFVYRNHFNNPFELDDSHTIVNNQAIHEVDIKKFFSDPRTFSSLPLNQAYRPGLTTLNAIDYAMWSKSPDEPPQPKWFHVSIFITFILLCTSLFFFYRKIFNYTFPFWQGNDYMALFSAAFFAFHTSNAETVNYIIARSDLYSTFFVILAFLLFFSPRLRKFHVFLLPVIIGFFIKEPTIMFAPLAFLFVFFFEENASFTIKDLLSAKFIKPFVWTFASLILGIFLIWFAKHNTLPTWSSGAEAVNPFRYFITNFYSVLHYVFNFVLPVNLAVDTDVTVFERLTDDRVLSGGILILILLVLAVRWSRRRETRAAAFGIFWFFITLIPTSTFFPFSEPLNDHRTFFGYIGLVLTASTLLANLIYTSQKSRVWVWSACFVLLIAHGFGVVKRTNIWSSEEALWKDAAYKCPNSGRIWMNYGLAQMKVGKYNEAYENFVKAKDKWPYYPYVYINLGIVKNILQMQTDAESDFKTALQYGPGIPDSYKYYGDFLLQKGRTREADSLCTLGLKVSPYSADLLNLRAAIDKVEAATVVTNPTVPQMLEAIKTNPSADNWLNLSLAFYNAGDFLACVDAARQVLKINPNSDLAYNNICAAYNMLKEWDKAIEAGQKGLQINPGNKLLAGNLNVALEGKKKGK